MKHTNMHNRLILALAATPVVMCALALTGCQKDGVENVIGQNDGIVKYAVAFGDGPQSKGALVNTTGNNDKALDDFTEIVKEFKVEAYSGSSTEASFSQTVTWDDSKWVADPVEYWPQATSLKFFAYANTPASTVAMNAECTAQTLTYAVPADASEHQDILLGYYYGNGGNKGIAELRFNHPLTAVRFRQGNMTGVTIKSITLSGLISGGTVTMTSGGIGDWTVGETEKYETEATLSGGEGSLAVEEGTDLIGTDIEGHYNGAFLPVPQKLDESDGGHPVTVTVVLATADGDVTVSADITSGEWQAGKTNTYTLNYGSNNLSLTLDVTPWNEDAETEELSMKEELLPGHFSVGQSKYVRFSCGNLFCTDNGESSSPRYTFGFEMNQYDCRTRYGYTDQKAFYNGVEGLTPEHTSGLFQWGVSSGDFGTFSDGETYSAESMDWGPAKGSEWTTLAKSEWEYLLNGRTCDNRFAKAIIGSLRGLLLFPDDWIPGSHTIDGINDAAADHSINKISISEFSQLEREGVVFLPSSGSTSPSKRDDDTYHVEHFNEHGNYYTTTTGEYKSEMAAYFLGYDISGVGFPCNENYGRSVRLVQKFFKPHDAVYIGGKWWATMNVGATTVAGSPSTCYGDYFAWGETEPYYSSMTISDANTVTFNSWKSDKSGGYEWKSYKYSGDNLSTLTKYNDDSDKGTVVDDKTFLDQGDDAATQNWGPLWRTPTMDDFLALCEACGVTTFPAAFTPGGTSSTTAKGIYWCDNYDGVSGVLFSDGVNRVFFPAAGRCSSLSNESTYAGKVMRYWSSKVYKKGEPGNSSANNAYGIFSKDGNLDYDGFGSRYQGRPVRPLHD